MTIELEEILLKLKNAKFPEDIFSGPSHYKSEYRHLTHLLHPDKLGTGEPFRILTDFYKRAEIDISRGTFGNRFTIFEIRNGKISYTAIGQITSGLLSDIYKLDSGDVAKISKHPSCNDFIKNEAAIVGKIRPKDTKEEKFFRYFPKLLDHFVIKNKGLFAVNIFEDSAIYKGEDTATQIYGTVGNSSISRISLIQLRKHFTNGLDFRDAAWIYKRILEGIGYIHQKKIFHNAITPDHIFIHPLEHGAKIIDWCWAGETKLLGSIIEEYQDFYAPEILAKQSTSSSSDIYMATKCMIYLLGGDVKTNICPNSTPTPLLNFLKGCLLGNPNYRPQSAWDLHQEFKDLMFRLIGKPTYRPLSL